MRRRTIHCGWITLVAAGLSLAQGPATAERPLPAEPSPRAGQPLFEVSLRGAVELALAPNGNALVQQAAEVVQQWEARRGLVRAELLPQMDGKVVEQEQTNNLEALGLSRRQIPLPGLNPFVGPFTTFDARLAARQTVFSFSSIRRFQAARMGVREAELSEQGVRNEVAARVALLYAAALGAQARLEAGLASVRLAEELAKLAQNQKDAGTGLRIEVTRAQVQLANERQRLVTARGDARKAVLELLKAMGLSLDTPVRLSEPLRYVPYDAGEVGAVVSAALASRQDYLAQRQREARSKLAYSAAKWEALPSVQAFGDYGSLGISMHDSRPTRRYGLALQVPLFDGGRRQAQRAEARSQQAMEKIRTADLAAQVELEVRMALENLKSAAEAVAAAEQGFGLAGEELEQARRRYEAGLAVGVEITDAQTRLERARENRILALYQHAAARIQLGQAMGDVRSVLE